MKKTIIAIMIFVLMINISNISFASNVEEINFNDSDRNWRRDPSKSQAFRNINLDYKEYEDFILLEVEINNSMSSIEGELNILLPDSVNIIPIGSTIKYIKSETPFFENNIQRMEEIIRFENVETLKNKVGNMITINFDETNSDIESYFILKPTKEKEFFAKMIFKGEHELKFFNVSKITKDKITATHIDTIGKIGSTYTNYQDKDFTLKENDYKVSFQISGDLEEVNSVVGVMPIKENIIKSDLEVNNNVLTYYTEFKYLNDNPNGEVIVKFEINNFSGEGNFFYGIGYKVLNNIKVIREKEKPIPTSNPTPKPNPTPTDTPNTPTKKIPIGNTPIIPIVTLMGLIPFFLYFNKLEINFLEEDEKIYIVRKGGLKRDIPLKIKISNEEVILTENEMNIPKKAKMELEEICSVNFNSLEIETIKDKNYGKETKIILEFKEK